MASGGRFGRGIYELLVLRPAFNSPDRLRLIEQFKECQAQRPRSVDPRVPRDLETIVLKAMDREPKRRYQSADQLSDDLRHFLAGEPIKARRTGELERLRCGAAAIRSPHDDRRAGSPVVSADDRRNRVAGGDRHEAETR